MLLKNKLDNKTFEQTRRAAANRRLAQWQVTWLFEHSTSHQISWSIDSFVLRFSPLHKAQTVCDMKDNQFDYPCFKTDESRSLDDDFQE
jgi:hypothetical protein